MSTTSNQGTTALVTGASSGIGYELAKLFARDGYGLVLVARDRQRLVRTADEFNRSFGIDVRIIAKDLSSPTAAEEILKELQQSSVRIDVLVNNAGYGVYGPFAETDSAEELGMIQTNLVSLTQLTKELLTPMVKRGSGKILNVASTAAFQPGPLMAVYYASKAYLLSFSEALANELQGSGVTVTVLCPGPTVTEFQKRARMERSKHFSWAGPLNADRVARIGYRGMMKGKTVVIPGLINKLLAFSVRFSPRKMVTWIVRRMQEERNTA